MTDTLIRALILGVHVLGGGVWIGAMAFSVFVLHPRAERFFSGASVVGHPRLAPALVTALVGHVYEAHIRELEYLVRRCIEASTGSFIVACAELEQQSTAHVEKSASALPAWTPPGSSLQAPTRQVPMGRGQLEQQVFTQEERHLLTLQRHHGFNMSACGRDPNYPGVRQTATRHIRVLLAKALFALNWQVPQAVALVGGAEVAGPFTMLHDEACARVLQKLEGFLAGLREWLPVPLGPEEASPEALREEYGADTIHILRVLGALKRGQLQAPIASATEPPAGS